LIAADRDRSARRFSWNLDNRVIAAGVGGNMSRRIRGASLLAGLAVILAGGRAAQAGGIIITSGTVIQTGDPTYEYIFDTQLLPGSSLHNGGFFTIYDLPGIPQTALTSQPSILWGSSIQLQGVTPPGISPPDDPQVYNVTWGWNGSSPITAPPTSNLDLGTFVVGSTVELPSPPQPTLVYVGFLNDGVTPPNEGTIKVTFVPEPSSVILLVLGAGALPLFVLGARRRRLRPRAA
jgi:hypothetical protein